MKLIPVFCASLFFLASFAVPIHAQQATTVAPAAKKIPLSRVLVAMQYVEIGARRAGATGSAGNGFSLAAESSVAQSPVTAPAEPTTAATIETQLDALVKELPKGTHWVKLMLPPPPPGKTLKGDDLADFALAQARLFGTVGEAVLPEGSVEVLSQPVSRDKAGAVVPALNLRPVYLVINPRAHAAMTRGVRDFADLTPDQQKAWAKIAAPQFMALSPAERKQAMTNMMGQFGALMGAVTENLNEEQTKQFFLDMGGKVGDHKAEISIDSKPKKSE